MDELLLRVYVYLNKKSSEKCCELETVVEELKACLIPNDFPLKGRVRSLCACGTRYIAQQLVEWLINLQAIILK